MRKLNKTYKIMLAVSVIGAALIFNEKCIKNKIYQKSIKLFDLTALNGYNYIYQI